MNPIPLLSFNRKASEAVWQFTLLHVSVWLGREICFCFQASVVLAVFHAVQAHIQARGSPAQAAPAVSLVMENSPFASPFPCWLLLSKHEHLPPASNPSPGWYWSAGFKAGVGFQSLLDHIGSAVWRSGRAESQSFEAHLITSLHLLGWKNFLLSFVSVVPKPLSGFPSFLASAMFSGIWPRGETCTSPRWRARNNCLHLAQQNSYLCVCVSLVV